MSDRPLRIDWRAASHAGTVREINEDSYTARPQFGIWAVADGMGGHEHGDRASAAVVSALDAVMFAGDMEATMQACAEAIHRANADIVQLGLATGGRAGSTVAVLVLNGRTFGLLWAGDSRAYLLRNRTMHQLTQDHTQVQEMIDRGLLSMEEASSHPMRHVLSRAVGVGEALEIDAITDTIEPGDVFMLCSDGLYGAIPETEFAAILRDVPLEQAAGRLIEESLAHDADDNVTVIVVRAQEPTLLALQPAEPALS